MKVGYVRVSKNDGSQQLDLQKDALLEYGVKSNYIYEDMVSGAKEERPGLTSCLKSLREGDVLVLYSLDRFGRTMKQLVKLIVDLEEKEVSLVVLNGIAAGVDTRTPMGKMLYYFAGIFAENERLTIIERTKAGLAAGRARGRKGGRPTKINKNKLKLIQIAMKDKSNRVIDIAKSFNLSRETIYRYFTPEGKYTDIAKKYLASKK